MLERYFREVLIEKQLYTRIGNWWDRKGENKIDIVAENEMDNEAVFYEVKRNAENIDCDILIGKTQTFLKSTEKFKNYELSYKGLSMQDM